MGPVAGRLIRSAVGATGSWRDLVAAVPEGPRRDRVRLDVAAYLDDRVTSTAGHTVDLPSMDGIWAAPLPELRAVTEVIVGTLPPNLLGRTEEMAAE